MTFAEGSQLERIGEYCFYGSGLEEFLAPPELNEIERGAFMNCWSLNRVVLNEGLSRLGIKDEDRDDDFDLFWCGVFMDSVLKEITFPSTVLEIGKHAFAKCDFLRVVWMINEDDGHKIRDYVDHNVEIRPVMVGDTPLSDLRKQEDVTIPNGIKTIEGWWFKDSLI